MKKKNGLSVILKRISLPTPAFFKKAQYIGGLIGGFGAVVLAMTLKFPDSSALNFFLPVAKEMVAIGATIVGMAQLVVTPQVPNKDLP